MRFAPGLIRNSSRGRLGEARHVASGKRELPITVRTIGGTLTRVFVIGGIFDGGGHEG